MATAAAKKKAPARKRAPSKKAPAPKAVEEVGPSAPDVGTDVVPEGGGLNVPPEAIADTGAVPAGGFDLDDIEGDLDGLTNDPAVPVEEPELNVDEETSSSEDPTTLEQVLAEMKALRMENAELRDRYEAARPKERSRRACLLIAQPKGNSRLYVDGVTVASWDKNEPAAHIWRQVAVHTDEQEIDVVHMQARVLPDLLPPAEQLGKFNTYDIKDKVVYEPRKPAVGVTTSYHTTPHPLEALG